MTSPSKIPPDFSNEYSPEYLLSKIKVLGFNSFEELKGVEPKMLKKGPVSDKDYLIKLSTDCFHALRVLCWNEYGFDIAPTNYKKTKDMK